LITLIQILQVLVQVVWWILILQFILSVLIAFNVVNMQSEFVRSVAMALDRVTEPLYRPIRRYMPRTGAIDLSPMVVIVILIILDIVLGNLASHLRYGTPM
jgi:YggT family protein